MSKAPPSLASGSKEHGRRFGDSHADIRAELSRYGELNGYQPTRFADVHCPCGSDRFRLSVDDDEGVAVRRCTSCGRDHVMADGADYLDGASPEECGCPCGGEHFQLACAASLYGGSDAARWFYVGCRCVACGLTATYGDWKCEHDDARALLSRA